MIIFLHGADAFLVGRRKLALQKAFQKKYPDGEVLVFDFEDNRTPEYIRRSLQVVEGGLFDEKKMVVFLHPFAVDDGGEKALIDFLKGEAPARYPESVYLFVEPGKIKKTHPLAKTLLRLSEKEEFFPKLDNRDLKTFVKKELAGIDPNTSFSPEALELFVSIIGSDAARLSRELEKLALYKEGEVIEKDDVLLLVADERSREKIVFEALDALGRGRKNQALLLFREEARKGDGVYGMLALCAWQVRKLLAIREATDKGMDRASDIARTLKLPPFAVERALGSIRDFPLPRLKKGLMLLSDLDVQMKQGTIEPEVALDLFVWKF